VRRNQKKNIIPTEITLTEHFSHQLVHSKICASIGKWQYRTQAFSSITIITERILTSLILQIIKCISDHTIFIRSSYN